MPAMYTVVPRRCMNGVVYSVVNDRGQAKYESVSYAEARAVSSELNAFESIPVVKANDSSAKV